MAKVYGFNSGGALVPVHAMEAGTSLSVASGALFADEDGVVIGAGLDLAFSGGSKITGLAEPVDSADAATKSYVESYANSVASGLDVKRSVLAASTDDVDGVYDNGASGVGATLTGNANGELVVDGVALEVADRILVKDQAASEENGLYVVTATGGSSAPYILTRSTDADTGGADGELTPGAFTFVVEGDLNADTGWVLSSDVVIVMGTTANTWTQFSSAGIISAGAGLVKSGNTIDVASANSGIVVNANDIELALASNSGLQISSGLAVASTLAGNGLAFASGVMSLDLNELESKSIDPSTDSFAFIDSSNASGPRKVTVEDFVTAIAGAAASTGLTRAAGVLGISLGTNSGLAIVDRATDGLVLSFAGLDSAPPVNGSELFAYSSGGAMYQSDLGSIAAYIAGDGISASSGGVLALALGELAGTSVDVANDSFVFIDASNGDASRKASLGDLATAVAGEGLGSSMGVLSVNTDGSTLEINSDSLRVKDAGIVADKIGTGAVTTSKMELLNAVSALVAHDAVSSPNGKAARIVVSSGKLWTTSESAGQAGATVQGLFANAGDIAAEDDAVDLYTVDGSLLAIPSAARNAMSFDVGATVFASANGILTTNFDGDFGPGDWACPVGTALSTSSMLLRIGLPLMKA